MGKKKKPAKWVWRKKEQSTASSSAPPPPPPPWVELPRDLTANILERLGPVEILESAQKVCTTWRSVCKDPSMWRQVKMCSSDDFDAEIMCQYAVDRSEGQLLNIMIHGFGSDMLLEHIANRSSQLRCLTLAFCHAISAEGIVEAIKRFPLMEELHLSLISAAGEFVELLGHSCPRLKSFSINKPRSRFEFEVWDEVYVDDSEALAIAKSMPQLCHLCLIGNHMSNQGLMAILDSCTHLESLDLRLCNEVDLKGDLGKRCSQQLKLLKQPNEHAGEYDFEYTGEYDDAYDDDYDDDYDDEVDNVSYDGYPDWLGYDSQMSDYDESDFSYDDLTRWDADQEYDNFVNIFSELYGPDLLSDG